MIHLQHQEGHIDPHQYQIDPVSLHLISGLIVSRTCMTYDLSGHEEVDLNSFRYKLNNDREGEP